MNEQSADRSRSPLRAAKDDILAHYPNLAVGTVNDSTVAVICAQPLSGEQEADICRLSAAHGIQVQFPPPTGGVFAAT